MVKKTDEITILNRGNAPCSWNVTEANRLKVVPSSGSLEGNEKVIVRVTFTPDVVDLLHDVFMIRRLFLGWIWDDLGMI